MGPTHKELGTTERLGTYANKFKTHRLPLTGLQQEKKLEGETGQEISSLGASHRLTWLVKQDHGRK